MGLGQPRYETEIAADVGQLDRPNFFQIKCTAALVPFESMIRAHEQESKKYQYNNMID